MLPALTLLAFGVAAFGWGALVVAWAIPDAPLRPARTIAFGLVLLTAIGGLLNAVHLVSPFALDALVVMGWLAAALFIYRARLCVPVTRDRVLNLAPYVLPFAILIFLSVTILPGNSLNTFDDFSNYLVLPVRLLQTGSLAGDVFDGAGTSALGAQAFFQAFIVRWFAYEYLPAFDGVFCCVLATALVAEIAQELGAGRIVRVIAGIVFIVVNPAIVNLTSVYSGSLMILAMIAATILLAQSPHNRRIAILAGACGAALVVFKLTYLLIAIVYWSGVALFSWRARDVKIASLSNVAWLGLGVAVVLLPWLLVYAPELVTTLWPLGQVDVNMPAFSGQAGAIPEEWPRLWSGAAFFYGATFTAYGVALVLLTVAAAGSVVAVRASRDTALLAILAGPLAAACLISIVASSYITDFNSVLRFASPALAVALAVTSIWISRPSRRIWIGAAAVAPAVTCALFAQNFIARVSGAAEAKTLIAFAGARSDDYRLFLRNALSPDYRAWIADLQGRIAENEKILAWTSVSFLMDFERNPILVYSPQGYVHPFLNFPSPTSQTAATTAQLKSLGIRYIVWEYAGYSTRSDAYYLKEADTRFLGLRRISYSLARMQVYLRTVASWAKPMYVDSRMAIFDVQAIPDQKPN